MTNKHKCSQDAIAGTLLGAVKIEAGLSLEPILILVAALARDLQADFLPYVPGLACALTQLVEQGVWPSYLVSAQLDLHSITSSAMLLEHFEKLHGPACIMACGLRWQSRWH